MKFFDAKKLLYKNSKIKLNFSNNKNRPFNIYRSADGHLIELRNAIERKLKPDDSFDEGWYNKN